MNISGEMLTLIIGAVGFILSACGFVLRKLGKIEDQAVQIDSLISANVTALEAMTDLLRENAADHKGLEIRLERIENLLREVKRDVEHR